MVPDKFNIVDFGGFDLVEQYGETLPGIYDKIVDAHWNCVYIMCFGLKFAGFDIAPQYMTPEMLSDHVMLNGIISIDRNDVITIPSLMPPPDPPVIQPLTATENRVYEVPEGVDGFNPVTVQVPPSDITNIVNYAVSYTTAGYQGGIEHSGYTYGNAAMIESLDLTLLGDFSQGADGGTLEDSIENYSAVILQGVYQKNRTSQYNTSILYYKPELSRQYWSGMKDRNASYTCYVTFVDATNVTLAGNKQVIIYGVH